MHYTYTFCPRCSARMIERETAGKLRPVCPACGLVIYHNPRVVACVIPVRDGKVALVRRAMNPRLGTWVFPGGYVDVGEAVDEAARRETWEETGLHVHLERLLGVYSRQGEDVVLIVYVGHVVDGELTAGEEQIEAAWFAPAGLPEASELGFWSTVAAIEDWRMTSSDHV